MGQFTATVNCWTAQRHILFWTRVGAHPGFGLHRLLSLRHLRRQSDWLQPQKRGRPSHHPLLAFLSEVRRLLGGTIRPGKVGTANVCVELLQQALPLLPAGHRVALVWADAGFFLTRFLTFLESQDLPYIIMIMAV